MSESQFTRHLLKALRSHVALRDAVIWKLNDRTTRGIPDVLISLRGVTTFFELKCWPNDTTKIQKYFLNRLSPRAYIVTRLLSGQIIFHAFAGSATAYEFNEAVEEIVQRCINA